MIENKSILLLEDDDLDAKTVQRALSELHIINPFIRVVNGEEGLSWLNGHREALPGLILLDLDMPIMNGIEFLKLVKRDETLRRIPVVILTTSRLEADRIASFDLSVAGYMIKPVDYIQFVEVVRGIGIYWTLSETA